MRFVASTILSVTILAFVTQSVSAAPAGSNNQVEEVSQESNVFLKRTPLKDDQALYDGCKDGTVPMELCESLFGPGPY